LELSRGRIDYGPILLRTENRRATAVLSTTVQSSQHADCKDGERGRETEKKKKKKKKEKKKKKKNKNKNKKENGERNVGEKANGQ
jgi:hypothetical protein